MIKLNNFTKGEKKGKTIGIFSPSRLSPYKETKLPGWQESYNLIKFLKDYVGYDKVYILNWYKNDKRYEKLKEQYPYLYNLKNIEQASKDIDEILQKPDGLVCFGGALHPTYYYICSLIWYKRNDPNFKLYYYDHDPQFNKFNFVRGISSRNSLRGVGMGDLEQEYIDIYMNHMNDLIEYIDKNTIGLYGGLDYESYCQKLHGDMPKIQQWQYFDINEYSFANNFDFTKILTEIKFDDKYKFGYFGIKRRNKVRLEVINNLLGQLDNSGIIIGNVSEIIDCSSKFKCIDSMQIPDLYYFLNDHIKSSLFITDPANWNNYKSFRFFENLLLDYVGFIYDKQDINKVYINNEELKNYIYVNENNFLNKVEEISNNEKLYKHLVYLERKEFYDQMSPYMLQENKDIFENWLNKYKAYE